MSETATTHSIAFKPKPKRKTTKEDTPQSAVAAPEKYEVKLPAFIKDTKAKLIPRILWPAPTLKGSLPQLETIARLLHNYENHPPEVPGHLPKPKGKLTAEELAQWESKSAEAMNSVTYEQRCEWLSELFRPDIFTFQVDRTALHQCIDGVLDSRLNEFINRYAIPPCTEEQVKQDSIVETRKPEYLEHIKQARLESARALKETMTVDELYAALLKQ